MERDDATMPVITEKQTKRQHAARRVSWAHAGPDWPTRSAPQSPFLHNCVYDPRLCMCERERRIPFYQEGVSPRLLRLAQLLTDFPFFVSTSIRGTDQKLFPGNFLSNFVQSIVAWTVCFFNRTSRFGDFIYSWFHTTFLLGDSKKIQKLATNRYFFMW